MKISHLTQALMSTFVLNKKTDSKLVKRNIFSQYTTLLLWRQINFALIGCIVLIMITACESSSPDTSTNQAPANTISWGKLTGDVIKLNRLLTCGVGCPEPLHVRIETIQIDKTDNVMTWNANFFAPANTSTSGITNASFPDFALQSNTTPNTQASLSINSPGNLQAKFPFIPVSSETYTFTVTASYQTLTNGIISIDSASLQYEPVTMSFQS